MDDNKLYDLFADYDPDLSSDSLFMSRLEQNLEAVELVKEQLKKSRSKNRFAIIVAAITGFVAGILSVLYYPALRDALFTIAPSGDKAASVLSAYGDMLPWGIVTLIVFAMTYGAYDITLTIAKRSLKPIRLYRRP